MNPIVENIIYIFSLLVGLFTLGMLCILVIHNKNKSLCLFFIFYLSYFLYIISRFLYYGSFLFLCNFTFNTVFLNLWEGLTFASMGVIGSFLILLVLPYHKNRMIIASVLMISISSLGVSFWLNIRGYCLRFLPIVNVIPSMTLSLMLFLWLLYILCNYKKEGNQTIKPIIRLSIGPLIWSIFLTLVFISIMKKSHPLPLPPLIFLLNCGVTIYYIIRYYWNLANSQKIVPANFYSRINLTTREKEITHLLSQGLSYQEIADKLFISFATVNTHTRNIYKKAGVKNRHDLINAIYGYDKIITKSIIRPNAQRASFTK